jgi:hypothetical protein
MSYEFICHMNSYAEYEQLTFDSTVSGLGAFQILNRNITSSLRPLPAMLQSHECDVIHTNTFTNMYKQACGTIL